jgi:hypothetical protein
LLERSLLDCEELRREFAKALRPLFEQDGQAEKKMADAFESACRLCVARRVIPLRVAQEPMAVAADWDQFVIVGAAGDVMKLQRQRVFEPAHSTTRRIRTQSLQCALLATLAVQFVVVHGQIPSNDDAIDVLEALVVGRSGPIERVWSGLEWVRPSGNVSDARPIELGEKCRVVGPQKVSHGGHEAADLGRRVEVADNHSKRAANRKEFHLPGQIVSDDPSAAVALDDVTLGRVVA